MLKNICEKLDRPVYLDELRLYNQGFQGDKLTTYKSNT